MFLFDLTEQTITVMQGHNSALMRAQSAKKL